MLPPLDICNGYPATVHGSCQRVGGTVLFASINKGNMTTSNETLRQHDAAYQRDQQVIQKLHDEFRRLDIFKLIQCFQLHRDKCAYCGTALHRKNYTKDHVVPKSMYVPFFGKDIKQILGNVNLVPACKPCNRLKKDMTLLEFMQFLENREIKNRYLIIQNIKKLFLD